MAFRKREISAIVPVLVDIANEERTPEEIAEIVIETLDAVRARTHRLAVVAQYTLDHGETLHHAVLGPFPTTARVSAAAAAEGFVGRPSQPGQGRFMLVPAYQNTRDAWEAITPNRAERRRIALALAEARRQSDWNPWQHAGPCCHCGIRSAGPCPVHPGGR